MAEALSEEVKNPGFIGIRKDLQVDSDYFDQQLLRGEHIPLIEALIGDKAVPSSAGFFDKPDQKRSVAVGPHSDSGGRRNGATLWVALDRADEDNGCLVYLKKSHLREKSGEAYAPMAKDAFKDVDESTAGATAFVANPGDAVIHSSMCVHWSRPSSSDRSRRSINYFYWSASEAAWEGTPVAKPRGWSREKQGHLRAQAKRDK